MSGNMNEKGLDEHVEHRPVDVVEEGHSKSKYKANTQMDDAAKLLEQAGAFTASAQDRKRVLRQIDIFVCIPMCIVYFIQQMDKATLTYAATFDLREATGLVGQDYAWLTSVVYCAQLVFQPLSAYALIAFPVKYWVIFNYFSWSCVTLCTAATHNFAGLMTARVFLGIFEATILPSFVLITQMWWTRREQSYRTVAYQVANSCAAIFGPLLAAGVGHIEGKLFKYQMIFLTIGGISLLFVGPVYALLPNSPTTAKFLKNGDDRLIAIERVRENNTGMKATKWKWEQVWETYRDPKTYLWALMYLCTSCASGGFSAFGSLITKGFGFTGFIATVMQIPTGVIGIITLITAIFVTNKIKLRFCVIAFICLAPIAGGTALIVLPRNNTGSLIGAYYVAQFLTALQPLLYSWANLNASGTTKRVVTTATMFVFQCAGNIIGPQCYLSTEAPYYHTGLYVSVGLWSTLCLLCLTMGAYLHYLNKKQERRRVALGLPANLKDMSLMSIDEATKYRAELYDLLRAEGHAPEEIFAESFNDMTDFDNPMFMYVL